MGAEFYHEVFDCYDITQPIDGQITPWWDNMIAESRRESGEDIYAGSIGTMGDGLDIKRMEPLRDEAAARQYLMNNHHKWDPALAVPYHGTVQAYSAAMRKQEKRLADTQARVEEVIASILKEMRSTASKTIGCKTCGSSIARQYLAQQTIGEHLLNDVRCPVCSKQSLLTDTQRKRIAAAEKTHREATHIRVEKPYESKKGIVYAVGGWCAC